MLVAHMIMTTTCQCSTSRWHSYYTFILHKTYFFSSCRVITYSKGIPAQTQPVTMTMIMHTHHSNSRRLQKFSRGHDTEICNVDKYIAHSYQGNPNNYCQGKVSVQKRDNNTIRLHG